MHPFHFYKKAATGLIVGMLMIPAISHADIVLSGTRIVYPQASKDVIINMENRGNKPLLVQAWIDDGRDMVNPQQLKVPFIITPPVSRVDPAKGQTIRITYMGQQLPQDKESLFWFNVLEVPPKATDADDKNLLQLAFRTRIKILFRPTGLKGDPVDAVKNIKWSLQRNGNDVVAIAQNDKPWHISLSEGNVISNGKTYPLDVQTVAPFSKQEMHVKGLNSLVSGDVKIKAINDFGGPIDQTTPIN